MLRPPFWAVHQSTILALVQKDRQRQRQRESAKELAGKYAKLVEKSLADFVVWLTLVAIFSANLAENL